MGDDFPWKIIVCCSSSCEPDSEPTGVNEQIFGWTRWFLLEEQFCSLAMLPLCFSFCWKTEESQGEMLPCAQCRRLWKLCGPCWPHQGRECRSLPPEMLWSCFCAALFGPLKLSSPFEMSCLKKKKKTHQFDLKSFLKGSSSRLPASLALSEGTNASRVLFVALPGTGGLIFG